MISRGNTKFSPKLDRWLSERKLKIELFLTALVAVSLFAYHTQVLESPQMIMMSMTPLAIFYFLCSYLTPDIEGRFGEIAWKVVNISCAVCVIGLMFSILKFEGADQMMLIGTTSLAISGIIIGSYAIFSGLGKLGPLLLRIVIIGGVLGLFKLT